MSAATMVGVTPQKRSFIGRDATGTLVGKFTGPGTLHLQQTLEYAMNAYAFLVERGERLSIQQFIDRIREAYDCESCPQNQAVVQALRSLL